MLFRQLIDADLGCASYVIADGGEAIVVDPSIAIDQYLELAYRYRFGIAHVVETLRHTDHVSGNRRLAELTGAQIHVSAGVQPAFASSPLHPGDTIVVGAAVLTARATPGHRPEHLAFVLSDRGRDAAPLALLTGDALLVGEVGRPDLAVDARRGARALYGALRGLDDLGDSVEVWPGHIGGSLCGGASLSQKPSSTLGYERRANPYLAIRDEHAFVDRLVGSLPLQSGSIGTRAGWLLDAERPLAIYAESEADARRAHWLLAAVGLFGVTGIAGGRPETWQRAGLPVRLAETIDPVAAARGRARCVPASRSRSCASTAASQMCWRRWSGSPRRSSLASVCFDQVVARPAPHARRKRPREGTTR